jgi:hypothetical protein
MIVQIEDERKKKPDPYLIIKEPIYGKPNKIIV